MGVAADDEACARFGGDVRKFFVAQMRLFGVDLDIRAVIGGGFRHFRRVGEHAEIEVRDDVHGIVPDDLDIGFCGAPHEGRRGAHFQKTAAVIGQIEFQHRPRAAQHEFMKAGKENIEIAVIFFFEIGFAALRYDIRFDAAKRLYAAGFVRRGNVPFKMREFMFFQPERGVVEPVVGYGDFL